MNEDSSQALMAACKNPLMLSCQDVASKTHSIAQRTKVIDQLQSQLLSRHDKVQAHRTFLRRLCELLNPSKSRQASKHGQHSTDVQRQQKNSLLNYCTLKFLTPQLPKLASCILYIGMIIWMFAGYCKSLLGFLHQLERFFSKFQVPSQVPTSLPSLLQETRPKRHGMSDL
jgi:hypothetical protein